MSQPTAPAAPSAAERLAALTDAADALDAAGAAITAAWARGETPSPAAILRYQAARAAGRAVVAAL